jgi:parvulin-like peptidyl-prolyl isomerase
MFSLYGEGFGEIFLRRVRNMKIGSWFGTGRALSMAIAVLLAAGCQSGMLPMEKTPVQSPAPEHSGPADAAEAKKTVVAKVNGVDISLYSLTRMMDRMAAINRETPSPVSAEEMRKKALDQLIFQELSLQEAARQGLSVKESEIENGITAIVGHDTEALEKFLAKQNITSDELRAGIKRQILLQRIYVREVSEKINITEDDVRKEYERRKSEFIVPEKTEVVDVLFLLALDDPASLKKVDEVIAKINADKDKSPMNLVQDGTFVVRDLGIDKEKEPALYDAARKLKEGELSGLIKTTDSLHIIQLTRYTPEKQAPYEEVKGPLKEKMRVDAQRDRFKAWEHELRGPATIELLPVPERPQKSKP